MADDVRILPTEWVGTAVATTWGISTEHHPKHGSHGHLDAEWHAYVDPGALRILRQEGRSLEMIVVSGGHEATAVGVLSADGTRPAFAHGSGGLCTRPMADRERDPDVPYPIRPSGRPVRPNRHGSAMCWVGPIACDDRLCHRGS